MHQIIRIICYAISPEEARERAENILNNNLVGEDNPFDYGTFFDNNTARGSGKARWGNITSVCLADSKEGKKLITEGMKITKDEFIENNKKIKEMINYYSDEELFEEEVIDTKKKILESLENKKNTSNLDMFRYYCHCLGEYEGTNVYLYDNDGSGIRSNKNLKNVLNKWGADEYKNLKVFILPIDVHS